MVKKFAIAVAMVALMAVPSFAAVQNVKVGGDLKTTSVIRSQFDLGASTLDSNGNDTNNTVQNVVMSQVGLNVSADLTDNVSTTLRLVNERLWGTPVSGDDTSNDISATSGVDLDTANITMKELFIAPLTVTIGRQPLKYGNQLIIGDGDGTTTVPDVADLTGGSNFDAIKAVLNYDPLVIDLIAAKTYAGVTTSQGDDDADLYGINSNFKLGGDMNVVLEGYVFAKFDKSVVDSTNNKTQKLYVPGLRASLNPMEGLGLQFEGAYERGNGAINAPAGSEKVSAYALQGMFTFALPVAKDMKMGLSGGYTYLSGDKNGLDDNKQQAWQPVYENQWTGRIFDSLFTNSNMGVAELAFEMVPMADVTTKLSFYDIRQVKADSINTDDTINQPDSNGAVDVTSTGKKQLGNEFDLDVKYAYTEDVTFGLSAGIFKPGKAFDSVNQENATQVLTSVNVLF